MKTFYRNNKTVLINFTRTYYHSADELLSGENFRSAVDEYLDYLKENDPELYPYFQDDNTADSLIFLFKILYVINVEEISHPYLNNRAKMIEFVEGFYNYWRKLERCTVIYTSDKEGLQLSNFIESDTKYNQLILDVYRRIEENLLGRKNNVYRQLNAGSNASIVIRDYNTLLPEKYERLEQISFIDRMMLRTPLLLHPAYNKREGTFTEIFENPIDSFEFDREQWICYPAQVGQLLIFIYIHIDYLFSGLGLANLFELADDRECASLKPDAVLLFGNHDGKEECTFYHDKENEIWVGNVSSSYKIEYFGYLKKMTLTLHNLIMMERDYLPLHGSMIDVTFKNGVKKGIIFIGDSGAGKSETIEAFQNLAREEIASVEVIFDDMGSLHIEDDQVFAQGTETGAFVRLDDLDKGSAYREMDRSIFFNPESSNARVVLPVVTYDNVTRNHPVDFFLYANNYEEKDGLHIFENWEKAQEVFVSGKRFALGTTEESGLSTTFFANPFGPVQRKEKCSQLIQLMFEKMQKENIVVGEIFSHLGCKDKGPKALEKAATALLEEIIQ